MAINKTDLLIKTQETRNALGEDDHSPMDIFSLVQQIDKLTIVKYPMGDRLSGMCVKGNYNNIIVIN